MREERFFYVYLLTSSSRRVLYTGVTNSLIRRLYEHRAGECEFTAKYRAFRLVHLESFIFRKTRNGAIWPSILVCLCGRREKIKRKVLRSAQDDKCFSEEIPSDCSSQTPE